MQAEEVFMRLCGFEDDGWRVRVYFDEPAPLPLLGREHGVCSAAFRDLGGKEAEDFRRFLGRHRRWEYLRVEPAADLVGAGQD